MLSFFSSGQQIGQPKEIYRLSTMAVLLHPRPECLEIQKVLCPIEAILKHSQADCTRLEGSTLVNWKFAKLAGQIRYIQLSKWLKETRGEGYSREFWIGVCREGS